MSIKSILKAVSPPIFLDLKRSLLGSKKIEIWSKPLQSWEEAKSKSIGYEAGNILQKVLDSSRAVRDGKVPYERDSVLFDEVQYSWPLLSILQKIALENNNSLTLIDFGGSLGSTYFQNRVWLQNIKIKWIIVEQEHFVEIGKKEFQNDTLLFEYSLKDAFVHQPNVVLFSGVLQYLENPETIIEEVIGYGVNNILLDRTGIAYHTTEDIYTLQEVPQEIYKASYPCRFFKESALIGHFSPNYTLVTDFLSYCDPSFHKYGISFLWKGFFLKRNQKI